MPGFITTYRLPTGAGHPSDGERAPPTTSEPHPERASIQVLTSAARTLPQAQPAHIACVTLISLYRSASVRKAIEL